jgi:RluA family pseudouridine synthase
MHPRERVKDANFFVDTRYSVIHEDASYLVLEKPAPLAVHPVGSYFDLNLHSLLKKDPRWGPDAKIHFAHRLDAETSGCILACKTPAAARFAGIEFMNGRVKKKYRALVFGTPSEKEGEIDFPLGNDKSSGFQTFRVVDHEAGEPCRTRWRLLESFGDYSWIEAEPLTGRTHQIRAHLKFLGHPIVGDKIYVDVSLFQRYVITGLDAEILGRLKLKRLALHATELTVRHPETREEMTFRSEAPDFMKEIPC